MTWRRYVLLVVLLLAGCGGTTGRGSQPSTSASAPPSATAQAHHCQPAPTAVVRSFEQDGHRPLQRAVVVPVGGELETRISHPSVFAAWVPLAHEAVAYLVSDVHSNAWALGDAVNAYALNDAARRYYDVGGAYAQDYTVDTVEGAHEALRCATP